MIKHSLALLLACSVATSLAVPVTDLDQFIEELNQNLIPNKQWVAGKNFESMDDVIPLLGAWPDLRTEDEKTYRPGSYEAEKLYTRTFERYFPTAFAILNDYFEFCSP